jgi:putative membrane-bound dehydrogenase-like protein
MSSPRVRWSICVALAATSLGLAPAAARADEPSPDGVRPAGTDGAALNLDFETGTLKDWRAEGRAFERQPIDGDTVASRRSDMKSAHQGRYWVGTFERAGDAPQGTLSSVPFKVTHPWASFLVGGGPHEETRVEVLRADTGEVLFKASGDESENLKRVAVDLKDHQGAEIIIRVVDAHSGHWGHINFDDFRFHQERPATPQRNVLPGPDVYAHAGLPPQDAARAMTVPPGFKVTLFAGEPDVVQPIAMTIDDRGRLWVAEAYSYPVRVPDDQAKDRILIFEDTDNDGTFDKRTMFADRLNLVSGLEVGFGGAWVGAAPYLLFIPDKDGDDVPDGPPQVVLDGWAMQDTHETLNSFIWGPDGWLYGCHGVFTHSRVGKPGTPDRDRTPINAGIWRYHPTKQVFEVFAEGTSNPWGVDFDAHGQCFIEACVIPHLFHMVQGGRFERQAGQHFNPYTYDDIKTIADHRHYVGANPHAGNNRSDSAGGGHAHSGMMIYQGDAWPEQYRGGLFMNNIHGARINHDVVTPKGSGFVGSHRPDFLMANDVWSQIVALRAGPDGGAYMIDWYDKNQCHRNEVEMHDRTNGRVFKVAYGEPPAYSVDLKRASDAVLCQFVASDRGWFNRQARRLLQERGPNPGVRRMLAAMAFEGTLGPAGDAPGGALAAASPKGGAPEKLSGSQRLRALWALHGAGGLEEGNIQRGLGDPDPYIRAWTIQLACEDKSPSSATLAKMAELSKSDPSPVVRLYLASALQRLTLDQRWSIIEPLVQHAEDADDHNLPLMDWYAAEPLATVDAARAMRLAQAAKVPTLLPFMTRRIAALGTPEALALLIDALRGSKDSATRLTILRAVNEALQGRRTVESPRGWSEVFATLTNDADDAVRSQAIALGTTFGDVRAMEAMRAVLTDADRPLDRRREALAALLKARDAKLAEAMRSFVAEGSPLRAEALRGLATYDDPQTPRAILTAYGKLTPAERRDALNTLTARPAYTLALLDAIADKSVPATDVTADLIRNVRNFKDDRINARLAEVWGQARETSADKAKLVEEYRARIRRGYQDAPDPMLGRAVYARTCGQCHALFGSGGNVGPDLTGSNRADLDYILTNVLDPSALVGKDYQATVIATADGRTLTGIVKAEDNDAVTLATANETVIVPKGDIEERQLTEQSLMPEDQWANLSNHEIRSLVAYLASPAQVPLLVTPENASTFFNGKDLTGWRGDEHLWSVEDGEIVGKSGGLEHNAFLVSDMAAGDFRLTCRVKLVNNEGNSGIQFRSEPLPDGEMRGYQADIGPGWWGKLYEENGRELLWDKPGEEFVKPGEWNTYEIVAVGSKIVTKINGHVSVDLDDPAGARRGVFALQLHSGGPTEVRFKDLKLELNPSAE